METENAPQVRIGVAHDAVLIDIIISLYLLFATLNLIVPFEAHFSTL